MSGDRYEWIQADGEREFLDNGGSMSVERRDYYFARAMEALQQAENDRDEATACWALTTVVLVVAVIAYAVVL